MQNTNKQFGVAFVQMHVSENKTENIHTADRLVREAVIKYQPKLVVLPELFNTKWGKQYFEKYAEVFPTGETYVAMSKLAKDMKIFLVAGSFVERDAKTNFFYNTSVVFDPYGNQIAFYRKIHLFDFDFDKDFKIHETEYFKPGHELAYFEMDGVKVGLGIGYDLHFNELAQLYRKQGVHFLIYPSIYPTTFGYFNWEQLNRVRAIDNQMYVLGVSQARNDEYFDFVPYGRSVFVDYRGHVFARAGDDEEVLFAWVNFEELEKFRHSFPIFEHKRNDVYETIYKH